MRIGAVLPQLEIGHDPAVVRDWAQAAEAAGYSHLLAYDHVLGAGVDTRPGWRGYTSDDSFHEVLVLFGYFAALTTTVELVTNVVILPQRQTALVAKQAAEVDVLSGGRLRLGVGIGWNEVEYHALGVPFSERGARLTEQVEVLRKLWADDLITYDGKWHQIDNAGIRPLPPRRSIPIWFGGGADAVIKRTGRIGDGWFPQLAPNDEARAKIDQLKRYAEQAGRDPEAVGVEARLTLSAVPEHEWAAYAAAWRELGATHLGINTMGMGLSGAEHIAVLERVRPLFD
ncbi:LLM class F420-dependent oxidoreductase [Kribbella deserti]|uniref:LLM class F420-dependent oxidoreductase n=1 Tax=Kribbella deserti TaxID=1926257 RepID=A0ABV6QI83_9ACTN